MNLIETTQKFATDEQCLAYLVAMRWPNGIRCMVCGNDKISTITRQSKTKNKRSTIYTCLEPTCKHQFSATTGTLFHDSHLPLNKWFLAVALIADAKKSMSAVQIQKHLGIGSYRTAWYMVHRIRLAMKDGSFMKLGGGSATPCEADETFIGGKVKNMHRSRRIRVEAQKTVGLKNETKTIIVGILDRKKGKVRAEVVGDRKQDTLDMVIRRNVKVGSVVYTDDHVGYDNLRSRFAHESINKQVEGYIKGKVHTQGIENFWSLLKRGIGGTYVAVEPCHLSRYLDEQMFRFNNRKDNMGNKLDDSFRFESALSQVAGKRLTYAELTGKVGETAF